MGMTSFCHDKHDKPAMDPAVAGEAMKHGIPLAREAGLKALGARIHSNQQLAMFLSGLDIKNRRRAYEDLRGHLKFQPKSFLQLSQKASKAAKRRGRRGDQQ